MIELSQADTGPPMDIDTTCAPLAIDQSVAAMIADAPTLQSALPALAFMKLAPCAIPLYVSFVDAATPATHVPWPQRSSVVPSVPKSCSSMKFPRAGWEVFTPESTMEMMTPLPLYPDAHASLASIWGADTSSVRSNSSSSQIYLMISA